MKTHQLLLALRDFTRTALSAESPTPVVYLYDLPKNEPASYPFVLLRLQKSRIEDDFCDDSVAFYLGMHVPDNPEEAGLRCAALGDTLCAAFWRQRIIADRFELQFPLELVQPDPDRKQHDYHLFTLCTFWNSILPSRRLEGDVYGDTQLITRKNHG